MYSDSVGNILQTLWKKKKTPRKQTSTSTYIYIYICRHSETWSRGWVVVEAVPPLGIGYKLGGGGKTRVKKKGLGRLRRNTPLVSRRMVERSTYVQQPSRLSRYGYNAASQRWLGRMLATRNHRRQYYRTSLPLFGCSSFSPSKIEMRSTFFEKERKILFFFMRRASWNRARDWDSSIISSFDAILR